MFTGLVEETGSFIRAIRRSQSSRIRIGAHTVLEGTDIGDSIAVNGVCLTVVSIDGDGFEADVMPETMRRSTIGSLRAQDAVNLERALRLDSRLGGHIVTGHIDGTARIASIAKDGISLAYRLSASEGILSSLVEKGSVAIEGISLTIIGVDRTAGCFEVGVIPHTQQSTNLKGKRVGDSLNVECDIIEKYVRSCLASSGRLQGAGGHVPGKESRITSEFLFEQGF